jgi:fido (protein-threonine AMPylation protein)
MGELNSAILGVCPDQQENLKLLEGAELKRAVAQGGLMAEALMRKVVLGEKTNGEKLFFGEKLIREINKRVLFYYPGIAGQYREDDDTLIGGYQPAKAKDLPLLMYKFGTWLEDETHELYEKKATANIHDVLRVASAAHYGLTRLLHPFHEGNGRTARVFVNGILMLGTEELSSYQLAIPPVPLIRQSAVDEIKIMQAIDSEHELKMDPYIKAIVDSVDTGTLNPLEFCLANIWSKNLKERLAQIDARIGKHGKNEADRRLIGVFRRRLRVLDICIANYYKGKCSEDLIPDFFASKYIKK